MSHNIGNFSNLPQLNLNQYEHWSFMLHAHIKAMCGADTHKLLNEGPIIPQKLCRTTYTETPPRDGETEAERAARVTANAQAERDHREERWMDKTPDEFTGDDRRRDNLDGIVFNTIINTVPRGLQSKLRGCSTACEAWQKIKELSEGSTMAKKNKVDAAKLKFTSFRQKANESIDSLDLRFTDILNELEALAFHGGY